MKTARLAKKYSALSLNATLFLAFGLSSAFANADTNQLPRGLYRLAFSNDHNTVITKSGSCDEYPADDSVVLASLDPDLYRQKWVVIRQANGSYTIASECQPTVFLELAAPVRARYGTNGQVGAFGTWDPLYNYSPPHFSAQENYIVRNSEGHWDVINHETGKFLHNVDFLPAN